MEYDDKISFLKSYRYKNDRLTFINNQIMGIKGISYEEVIGGRKSVNDYIAEKYGVLNEMEIIENAIDRTPDEIGRTILGYKYLQFKSFGEIATIINYSLAHVKRIHKKSVNMILNDTE